VVQDSQVAVRVDPDTGALRLRAPAVARTTQLTVRSDAGNASYTVEVQPTASLADLALGLAPDCAPFGAGVASGEPTTNSVLLWTWLDVAAVQGGTDPRAVRWEVSTNREHRDRHQFYLRDPDLRAARAAHPWLVLWDNHDLLASQPPSYGGGVQAFREFVPMRLPNAAAPDVAYRSMAWGDLIDFVLMDVLIWRGRGSDAGAEFYAALHDTFMNLNPHFAMTNLVDHGYGLLDVDRGRAVAELYTVPILQWSADATFAGGVTALHGTRFWQRDVRRETVQ